MPWEKPTMLEIKMDAEIGGYQDEFAQRKAGAALLSYKQDGQTEPIDSPASAPLPAAPCG